MRRYIAARGESPAAFDRRCIPPGCVAPRSHADGILPRRALPDGRLTGLGATPDCHHGLLGHLQLRGRRRGHTPASKPSSAASASPRRRHRLADLPAESRQDAYVRDVRPPDPLATLRPSGTPDPLTMRTCALYGHSRARLGAMAPPAPTTVSSPPRPRPPSPRDTPRDRRQQPPGPPGLPGLPAAHRAPDFRLRSARPVA